MKNKKQFTLIELIIVIVVIGILAAMALPKFNGIVRDAKISAMIRDKETLEKTLIMYYQKNDNLPLLNEDQELIVNNENIGLTKIVLAEEVINDDMETIYTSLQETLNHYNDSEESLYRVNINELKDSFNKNIKYGYKKSDKDFYVYSTKTGNVYYYDAMINGNGTIQHSDYDTLIKENKLVNKVISPILDKDKNIIKNDNIISMTYNTFSLGYYHTMKIGSDGNLYAWGRNDCGQLGIGNVIDQNTPQLVNFPNGEKAISISLGGYHSMAISNKGNLYSWGLNSWGQLGIGSTIQQTTPQLVSLPNGVKPKFIFSGNLFSMVLGDDGNLYSWGYNNDGELGIGNTIKQTTPQLVSLPNGVKPKFISSGDKHSMIIGDDGNLYSWGYNYNGQLGIGNTINQTTPQLVNLPDGIKTKSISLGGFHSLMIGSDDNLYAWGYNEHGELGIGNTKNQTTPQLVNLPDGIKTKSIYSGYIHSLLIGSDNNLYSWGRNYKYSLGLNNSNDQLTPQLVNLPNNIEPKFIYANFLNSAIIGKDGDFFVWGANDYGQLGIGNKLNQQTPIKVELP